MFWNFIIRRKNDKDFLVFIKEEISEKTSGNIIINNVKINEDSFRNVFYINQYEINMEKISLYEYEINIYPIRKCGKLSLKFGCELETCLDMYCSNLSKIRIKTIMYNLKNIKDKNIQYWVELLCIYIKDVIISNVSSEFLKLFPYSYIAINPKSGLSDYLINMNNGEIIPRIDKITYDSIVFTRDASLLCFDTIKNTEPNQIHKQTLHCEIITPILTNHNQLSILYNTIIKPGCLNVNDSVQDDYFPKLEKVKPFDKKQLFEGLNNYFEKRHQKLMEEPIKIPNKPEYEFRTYSLSEESIDLYKLKIFKDDSISIKFFKAF